MRVLVTGARGQVGAALLASAPPAFAVTGLSHQDLDITDEAVVLNSVRTHRPDVIINAAAYTAVDRAEAERDAAERINAHAPRYLASAAREIGARLVHLSTDFVFDGTASVPYLPQAATNPLSTYGRTKRAGELAVLDVLPANSVVLRTAWVYSAHGTNFLRTMLRLMAANGQVRVVADQIGTPTAAHSVAGTIWKIVEHGAITGIHHWTDAGVASWYDFAVAIAEEGFRSGLLPADVTVTPIATHEYPTPARRPHYSVLDKTSLSALQIAPIHWRAKLRAVLGDMTRA
jgi:dTDP-4-dehydrorhamnose reductase